MALVATAAGARAQVVAGTALYVRQDSDRTTVIAPRLHVGAALRDSTYLDLVYTTDVWTSASIDIRTSASRAVTEQRDEINAAVSQQWTDFTLAGAYRYSDEPDYESHGGTLSGTLDFADNCSTLDLRVAATLDRVGRSGEPSFSRELRNFSARVGFTQVLDPHTLARVVYEQMSASGYNSSPYRFVGVGTSNGLCGKTAFYCIPENNPSERLRQAIAAEFRRALGDAWVAGASYRFYLDGWGLMSHTATAELTWSIGDATQLTARYRFYTQTAASHYQTSYEPGSAGKFHTNDKELSTVLAQRVALEFGRAIELGTQGHVLELVLSVAPSLYRYSNYLPLRQIAAIELTLATVFKL